MFIREACIYSSYMQASFFCYVAGAGCAMIRGLRIAASLCPQ
jgi:hypothetical protein